jgi:hypothetical protein
VEETWRENANTELACTQHAKILIRHTVMSDFEPCV